MSAPRLGRPAPDFTLPGLVLTGSTTIRLGSYRLSDHRGRPLVLAFCPRDNTPACTRQLCSYSSGLDQLTSLGATVWAISPQDLDSHDDFARRHMLRMPLLSDTDGTTVAAYGLSLPGLGLRRSVFVLDAEGIVRWRHVALIGLIYQTVRTLATKLADLDVGT